MAWFKQVLIMVLYMLITSCVQAMHGSPMAADTNADKKQEATVKDDKKDTVQAIQVVTVAVDEKKQAVEGKDAKVAVVKEVAFEGKCVEELLDSDVVSYAAVLPDGRLVTNSGPETIKLWKQGKHGFECIQSITDICKSPDTIQAIVVLPGKQLRIVVASRYNTLTVFDVGKDGFAFLCVMGRDPGPSDANDLFLIDEVMALSDGCFVTKLWDGTLNLWEADSEKSFVPRLVESHHKSTIVLSTGIHFPSLCFAGMVEVIGFGFVCRQMWKELVDGRVVEGRSDGGISAWKEVSDGFKGTPFLETSTDSIHSEAILALTSWSNGRVASASADRTIKIWEEKNAVYSCVKTITIGDVVGWLVALPDGGLVSCACCNKVRIWR